MPKTLTDMARRELIDVVGTRYRHSTTSEKRLILQEFTAITGYHRKSAIRALNRPERNPQPAPRTSRRSYDEEFQRALEMLWKLASCPCGKRLHKLLPGLIADFERQGRAAIDLALQRKLTTVSAATIDRLLRDTRMAIRSSCRLANRDNGHRANSVDRVNPLPVSARGPMGHDGEKSLDRRNRDYELTGNTSNEPTQ